MSGYELEAAERRRLVDGQLAQLRIERAQHQINVTRWAAIPAELRDGSEAPAIEATTKAIAILEAQIDALEGLPDDP